MSFAKTFHDLRRRRRLPYTAWRPEISPPYVSGIEKDDLVPSEKKLEHLASVFVEVARQQGAPDPEEDARTLFRERDRTYFVERANVEPDVAEVVVSVRELAREPDLGKDEREEVLDTLDHVITSVQELVREEDLGEEDREKVLDTLQRTAETLAELDPDEREQFVEKLDQTLEDFESNGGGDREGNGAR